MKKPILVLLVLLFLLILSCVYQKTEVLYAKTNDTTRNTLPTITLKPLPAVEKVVNVAKIAEETVTETVAEIVVVAEEAIVGKETKNEAEVVQKPLIKQETPTVTPATAVLAEKKDIEEIDALMQALKNREIAFKNRDAFELHLQQLIKQALDNRIIAISHMNNEELHLREMQKELIKDRDHAYNMIGQTNNPTSGE